MCAINPHNKQMGEEILCKPLNTPRTGFKLYKLIRRWCCQVLKKQISVFTVKSVVFFFLMTYVTYMDSQTDVTLQFWLN